MTLLVVVAAAAYTFLSPLPHATGADFTKAEISAAAAKCKTSVTFIQRAMGVIKIGSPIGYVVEPHSTRKQRKCLQTRVPSTRIGVIEAVPADLPTSAKKH